MSAQAACDKTSNTTSQKATFKVLQEARRIIEEELKGKSKEEIQATAKALVHCNTTTDQTSAVARAFATRVHEDRGFSQHQLQAAVLALHPKTATESLQSLVRTATNLEETLMIAYLIAYSGVNVDSTSDTYVQHIPDEATRQKVANDAKQWQTAFRKVSVEEMYHLNLTQYMLRSLQTDPYFNVDPVRTGGAWHIPEWADSVTGGGFPSTDGMVVPLKTFSLQLLQQMIVYESTGPFQDLHPFSEAMLDVYQFLRRWELEWTVRSTYSDPTAPTSDIQGLLDAANYGKPFILGAFPAPGAKSGSAPAQSAQDPNLAFRSIGEFYEILTESFGTAFAQNEVTTDQTVIGNLQPEQYGTDVDFYRASTAPLGIHQQFATVGNFTQRVPPSAVAAAKAAQPTLTPNYSPSGRILNVTDLNTSVSTIVEEGEGFENFIARARVSFLVTPQKWFQLEKDATNPNSAIALVANATLKEMGEIRFSHLYRFCWAYAGATYAQQVFPGLDFTVPNALALPPNQLSPAATAYLQGLQKDFPAQLNAGFLCLVATLRLVFQYADSTTFPAANPTRTAALKNSINLMISYIAPFLGLNSLLDADANASAIFKLGKDDVVSDDAKLLATTWQLPGLAQSADAQAKLSALVASTLNLVDAWLQTARDGLAPFGNGSDMPKWLYVALQTYLGGNNGPHGVDITKVIDKPTWNGSATEFGIKDFFGSADVSCMTFKFDLSNYKSVSENIGIIFDAVDKNRMPLGGPYWSQAKKDSLLNWKTQGCPE